ncbi:MAG: hypothetical protein GIX03_13710 [Candidatus Eremiobacteraeota bacterium]|nr:hypothetical protein [Candidatus Eremiobacteraeota bacterium]MBC5804022.1 hypothetical protein [Candidatus Eremiobacteraeota bacterium]MBC5820421.1 hypothetical protein [Candidatus Eremiobacteraeota bacterium]
MHVDARLAAQFSSDRLDAVGAVWLRRFSPRFVALGLLAFFGYFFALFLGATPAQLPWSIAAIGIGTACAFLLSFVILPDRQQIVRRAIATFGARQRAVLETLAPALAASHWEAAPRRTLRRSPACSE